ncbi:MAG: hypothetical protein ACO3SO_03630 [Luteolibacter sp.]
MNQPKAWIPLLTSIVLTLIILIYPLAVPSAFGPAGWIIYFYTVPGCGVLLLIGAWVSLSLSMKAHDEKKTGKQTGQASPADQKGCLVYVGKAALILLIVVAALVGFFQITGLSPLFFLELL